MNETRNEIDREAYMLTLIFLILTAFIVGLMIGWAIP